MTTGEQWEPADTPEATLIEVETDEAAFLVSVDMLGAVDRDKERAFRDSLIADHNRTSSLDAALTRAQTAEAALAEAEARIERMEAALRAIAEWDEPPGTVETVTNRGVMTRDIAREALAAIASKHPGSEQA